MMDKEVNELAQQLGEVLKQKGIKIVTAESCTGGGIAQAITDIPGSSDWFDRGFVTYSNQSKVEMLQVKQLSLDQFGAVSAEVAIEMVEGALLNSNANIAVSVTGIAGPSGGTNLKPVGTVYLAWQTVGDKANCIKQVFSGDREQVRLQTVRCAIKYCLDTKTAMDNLATLYQKSENYLKELLKQQLPENSQYFLFGSRARGDNGKMADIDIGIIAESALPLRTISEIKEFIEESFVPYSVDLVDFTIATESFKQQALRKVVPWN